MHMGKECQDSLWRSSVKGRLLVTMTPNLGHVFPVPGVPLEEGSLPFGECICQWSSAAFEEEPFVSFGLSEPRMLEDPPARSEAEENTGGPESLGETIGPGETEIFFGLRTGRFSRLDDSTRKEVNPEPGNNHFTYHKLNLFWQSRCRRHRHQWMIHQKTYG